MHLNFQLMEWTPPSYIDDPEDETTSPRDAVRTARAYQYATLLYLHQAVPEIPSPSAQTLAKRALSELASVEPDSRSCIIHIYPLMAAGCEMTTEEDRAWVIKRWTLLYSRMNLGIIEKSLTVTKEVWARRDTYAVECSILEAMRSDRMAAIRPPKRDFEAYLDDENNDDVCWLETRTKRRAPGSLTQNSTPISRLREQERQRDRPSFGTDLELLDPEFTVKGRLHWLGVMKDWNWEGENLVIRFNNCKF